MEKSPGLDGVTVEMIQKGWEYMKNGCCEMVRGFWGDGKMTSRVAAGVIKLIPKNRDTQELSNWLSLTMLSMTKKIISKIIANCIKRVAGKLVDQQQTGLLMAETSSII